MICDFGDVAVVPFPFVDMVVTKYRPALVLTAAGFNEANGNSILAMITTAKRSAWPSDLDIVDGEAAGLREASCIRWKVFTLSNDLIGRIAGKLGGQDRDAARAALGRIFA